MRLPAFILCVLKGEHRLFAQLLYGTGMRINEGLQLRVKDVDFGLSTIIVREGKGGKDRAVMLPQRLATGLGEQLSRSRVLWGADQKAGRGGVAMPDALDRKYPRAGTSWNWFWVFPQETHSIDPRTGVVCRHHMYDQTFQRARFVAYRHCQAGNATFPSPFFCNNATSDWIRHSYCAGIAWSCRHCALHNQ